jgi:homocysteine S-methyltransferase
VRRSRLASQFSRREFVISVELSPPRGIDPRRMLEGARLLKEAGVDFANVTDSALARLRMGVLSCAALVQQQVGLEAIAHFTTRDRNVMAIQSELIGAHALGLRNVLCLRGDPPRVGDYPNATAVWDVNAVGLITILANMNKGLDANGTPIGNRAHFYIGAAVNPNADDVELELRLLRRKLEAGADFLVSQPIYDVDAFAAFVDQAGPLGVPLLAGVLPLVSARHAEFLHNEVPGVTIPEAVRSRIAAAGEEGSTVGVELAVEVLDRARGLVQGAYVIPAFGRYDLAAQVVTRVRSLVG